MYNRKIKDLRAFLTETLHKYEYEKINLSDNEFAERLKMTCYFIDEKIISTIEYYQYNKAPITEIENAKDKCKDLSILLNKYKIELTKLGINPDEQLSFKKEANDAFDFELTENTKELLPNYLEIKKEFLELISNENDINLIDNLDTKELPQQINNSEILFPTLSKYIEIYSKLLSNYLREYEDNTEKVFIELQIEHWTTYGNEFLENEKYTFHKHQIEKLKASRSKIVDFLKEKSKSKEPQTIETSTKTIKTIKQNTVWFKVGIELAQGHLDKYFTVKEKKIIGFASEYNPLKIAKELKNEKYSQVIKCTLTPILKGENARKNILINKKQMLYLYEHCKSNQFKMTDFFIEKYNQLLQD